MEISWRGQSTRIREMGEGPAVVLVHGYPLDGAMWSGVARAMSGRFRVLKPDLPGRGETPAAASPTIDEYADFVGAILEALPSPSGLAGFSMGGYVALAAALALVDTRASADDAAGKAKRDEAIETVRSAGVPAIAEAMVPRLLAPAALSNADLVERLKRIMLRQKPETVAADLAAMRDRPDSRDMLADIAIPTLVVVGDADALTPPADSQAMVEAIAGARLVTLPAAGHLTPMERPGAVAAALGDFFAASLPAAAE